MDNVAIALTEIQKGETLIVSDMNIKAAEDVPVKHKLALKSFHIGDIIYMYGVPVGEVVKPIPLGGLLSVMNVKHLAASYSYSDSEYKNIPPDVSGIETLTFDGYYREDGQVGTANHWLFIPMVFCQNRNLQVLKDAFETELGFKK